LRKYNAHIVRVDLLKNSLEYIESGKSKKTGIRGRSKP